MIVGLRKGVTEQVLVTGVQIVWYLLYLTNRLSKLGITMPAMKPDPCILRGHIDGYIDVDTNAYWITQAFFSPLGVESIREPAKAFLCYHPVVAVCKSFIGELRQIGFRTHMIRAAPVVPQVRQFPPLCFVSMR